MNWATSRLSTVMDDSSRSVGSVIIKFAWIVSSNWTSQAEVAYTKHPVKSALLRLALLRLAQRRSAPPRLAPLRSAPLRSAPLRSAPLRLAPEGAEIGFFQSQ